MTFLHFVVKDYILVTSLKGTNLIRATARKDWLGIESVQIVRQFKEAKKDYLTKSRLKAGT